MIINIFYSESASMAMSMQMHAFHVAAAGQVYSATSRESTLQSHGVDAGRPVSLLTL